ncbi:MAG: hypothetical protein OEM81_13180 [Acidimicrobiia bacterium]|nr:hypothetical protein [Acidimicrobiia bacterium]MDH3398765.1 hypothetical protein [Acidimicrobiia bacterium]
MSDSTDFPHDADEPFPSPEPDDRPETPVQIGELHDIIDEMMVAVQEAKALPLSGAVRVEREEFLAMLEQLKASLPEELRAARWMVREREAFIARTNEKAKAAMDRANVRAKEMVSESNIIAEAVEEANILTRRAEGDARRIRLEAEDLAEDRLEHLEVLFTNLLKQVREARREFHQSRPAPPPVAQ